MAEYKKNIRCPICGRNTYKKLIYTGPVGIEEEHDECSHCGYYYSFTYGNSIEEIGKYTIAWSYDTPFYPLHKRLGKIERIAKRNYKKYNKKTIDYTERIGFYYGKNNIRKTNDVLYLI